MEIISSLSVNKTTCMLDLYDKHVRKNIQLWFFFNNIRDLKIEFFPRTANVKKSRDQGLAARFAV